MQRAIDLISNQLASQMGTILQTVEPTFEPVRSQLTAEKFRLLVSQFIKQAQHLQYEAAPLLKGALTIEDMDTIDMLNSSPIQEKISRLWPMMQNQAHEWGLSVEADILKAYVQETEI